MLVSPKAVLARSAPGSKPAPSSVMVRQARTPAELEADDDGAGPGVAYGVRVGLPHDPLECLGDRGTKPESLGGLDVDMDTGPLSDVVGGAAQHGDGILALPVAEGVQRQPGLGERSFRSSGHLLEGQGIGTAAGHARSA